MSTTILRTADAMRVYASITDDPARAPLAGEGEVALLMQHP